MCTMLDQRRRRWADVVQMLYKYFVLTGQISSAVPEGDPKVNYLNLIKIARISVFDILT